MTLWNFGSPDDPPTDVEPGLFCAPKYACKEPPHLRVTYVAFSPVVNLIARRPPNSEPLLGNVPRVVRYRHRVGLTVGTSPIRVHRDTARSFFFLFVGVVPCHLTAPHAIPQQASHTEQGITRGAAQNAVGAGACVAGAVTVHHAGAGAIQPHAVRLGRRSIGWGAAGPQ